MKYAQDAVQKVLKDCFQKGREQNAVFSMRSYAKQLGVSSAALSEIMHGKRRVSRKIALRFAERLGLDAAATGRLVDLFDDAKTAKESCPAARIPLAEDQFKMIADWYHFAILSLADTKDFRAETSWIASRLGIDKDMAASAMERLGRLGMLTWDDRGRLRFKHAAYKTSDHIASAALRASHAANLDLGRKALDDVPLEKRDFTAITMAVDPERLASAKVMIREFRDKLCSYLESGDRTQVYKFCMQLLPLTQDAPLKKEQTQ